MWRCGQGRSHRERRRYARWTKCGTKCRRGRSPIYARSATSGHICRRICAAFDWKLHYLQRKGSFVLAGVGFGPGVYKKDEKVNARTAM